MLIQSAIWYFFASQNQTVELINENRNYTQEESVIFRNDVVIEDCLITISNIKIFIAYKTFEILSSSKFNLISNKHSSVKFTRGIINRGVAHICINSSFVGSITNFGELMLEIGEDRCNLPCINNHGNLYIYSKNKKTIEKVDSLGNIHVIGNLDFLKTEMDSDSTAKLIDEA